MVIGNDTTNDDEQSCRPWNGCSSFLFPTENDDGNNGTKPQETARKTERTLIKQYDILKRLNYTTFLNGLDKMLSMEEPANE